MKVAIQTMVDSKVDRRLQALANAAGRSKASYVRRLLILHTEAVSSPKLLRALDPTLDGIVRGSKRK